MTDTIIRTGLYLRVSTAYQAATGVSLEQQEYRLRQGAERRGWRIAAVYCDDGYSGHSMDRPDVQRCLRDVAAGALDVVYILELERGHRNERDRHNFEHYLADHGVDLIYEAEPQYSRYSQRQAMRNMQGAMAQYYSDYIAEAVRDKMRYMAAVGRRYPNGQAPFGLRQNAEHRLEPDPEWFPWSRQMFERFAAGDSLYGIARWLQSENVTTPGMIEWLRKPVSTRGIPKPQPANTWHAKTVRRVLTNEAFHGTLVYGRRESDRRTGKERPGEEVIRIEDAWPRWIPDGLWYPIQDRLATHIAPARGRHIQHFALPAARCGLCGARVVRRLRWAHYAPTGKTYTYHKYICSNRNRGDTHCELPIFSAPELDRQIVTALATYLTGPQAEAVRRRALSILIDREVSLRRTVDDLTAEIENLAAQRVQAAQALTMHTVAISEALLRELDVQIRSLTGRIEVETERLSAAQAALDELPAARARVQEALASAVTLAKALADADTPAQRRILARLSGEVRLYSGCAEVPLAGLGDPLVVFFAS